MEGFIKTLTEQIRYTKARKSVAQEIAAHILDQAQAYEAEGLSHEEAVQKAVHEMGDPVEAGVALDRIHRPQTDWKMILMTFVFSILGFIIMCNVSGLSEHYSLARQFLFTIMGFAVITGVYFLDYSFIGRYAPVIYVLLTAAYAICYMRTPLVAGRIPGMSVLIYLYAPVYAGILYRSRQKGYAAIARNILLLTVTALIAFLLSHSIPASLNLYFVCAVMLIAAVCRNWFHVSRKLVTAGISILLFIIPALCLISAALFGSGYRAMRLRAFLDPHADKNGVGYLYMVIREHLASARFIGPGSLSDPVHTAPLKGSGTFVPLLIVQSYGLLAGCLLVLALALFLLRAFHITCHQKNQLGLMVSASCFLVFLVNCCQSLLVNIGMYPLTDIPLPFLSYGGSTTLTYAVLIGSLLSVHRYKKVLADSAPQDLTSWHPDIRSKRCAKESD